MYRRKKEERKKIHTSYTISRVAEDSATDIRIREKHEMVVFVIVQVYNDDHEKDYRRWKLVKFRERETPSERF